MGNRTFSKYLKVNLVHAVLSLKDKPTFRDNILLFSDTGGAGTWLAEKLRLIPDTAMLWEPLHKTSGAVDPNLNFGWTPYIPSDLVWEEAKKDVLEIISGSKLNQWIVSQSPLRDFIHAKRLLVKMVHGSALLPWLVNRISLPIKPIFLVRHPISTSLFQMKSEDSHWDWKHIFDWTQVEFSEYWMKHSSFIKTLKSDLETHVALWCLHNQPALQAQNKDKFLTVRFEDIVLYGRNELYRLFKELGVDPLDKEVSTAISGGSRDLVRNDPQSSLSIDSWFHQISDSEKAGIQRILDHFGIEEYSAFSPYPRTKTKVPNRETPSIHSSAPHISYPITLNPV